MDLLPTVTAVRMTGSADRAHLPLLVLGPSLGTSAATLWRRCAEGLTEAFDVLAWDLPGHGHNRAVAEEPFDIAGLAAGVLRVVDDVLEQRGEHGGSFGYAGDSVGGAVGLQLLLDMPDRVNGAVLLCTGARIGTAESWAERVGSVRAGGTASITEASAKRWFAPGFLDRDPDTGSALLHALQQADDAGYAQVCDALAAFDVRDRLGEVRSPVLAVAGAHDPVCPPDLLAEVADGVKDGRLVVLPHASHLAPAEEPVVVAQLIRSHLLGEPEPDPAQRRTRPTGPSHRPAGARRGARVTQVCETADEAVAGIADGATVLVGGFGMAGMPVHLVDALIRQGASDLTVVSNNAGNGDAGLAALLAQGRVRKVVCSFPRQHDSYVFDELYRAGKVELELVPQGNLAERMRAAGAGLGAFFGPTGVGTPLAEGRETREIDGRTYVLEYPIRGDVALIGAHRADRAGNLVYRKTARNFGPVMATAAALTIAEVSEVVEIGAIDPETVVTPSIFVDRVVAV